MESFAIALFALGIYALGKTFFWPTMLGVVAEQTPKGGALTLNAIAGIVPASKGTVTFAGEDIARQPAYAIVRKGLALSPEGWRLFAQQSVENNLLLGATPLSDRKRIPGLLERVYAVFPRLAERRHQLAGSMSGGEQQMLALGRALMLAPKILLVDEPSVGLAPILVSRTIDKIAELKERLKLTVLMAEQNFHQAVRIADRGYVIVHGKIEFEGGSADELNNNDLIRKFYLGL